MVEQGGIDCPSVLESEPIIRKVIDMVRTVTKVKNQYVKKALAVRRRFVIK